MQKPALRRLDEISSRFKITLNPQQKDESLRTANLFNRIFAWLYYQRTIVKMRAGLFISHVTPFLIILLCYNSLVLSQEIPTVEYERKVYIDVDYTFANEGLYKPYQIREIPSTKEKVVLDVGNVCFYVFTDDGKFIRKIGREGRGPGDLLRPAYFDVDDEGDIYVYEVGNERISIFNKSGKFLNSFKISRIYKANLFVTQKREIVINLPGRGYFMTVFSREGKIIQEIGEIPVVHSAPSINSMMSAGTPFKHPNGNYYIFLEPLHVIKIFDESGTLIREEKLDNVFPYLPSKESHTKEAEKMEKNLRNLTVAGAGIVKVPVVASTSWFWDIIYKNNKFYALPVRQTLGNEIDKKNLPIFVLNKDLEIEKQIIIPLEGELKGYISYETGKIANRLYSDRSISNKNCFEVLSDTEDILFPYREEAEIYLFTKSK